MKKLIIIIISCLLISGVGYWIYRSIQDESMVFEILKSDDINKLEEFINENTDNPYINKVEEQKLKLYENEINTLNSETRRLNDIRKQIKVERNYRKLIELLDQMHWKFQSNYIDTKDSTAKWESYSRQIRDSILIRINLLAKEKNDLKKMNLRGEIREFKQIFHQAGDDLNRPFTKIEPCLVFNSDGYIIEKGCGLNVQEKWGWPDDIYAEPQCHKTFYKYDNFGNILESHLYTCKDKQEYENYKYRLDETKYVYKYNTVGMLEKEIEYSTTRGNLGFKTDLKEAYTTTYVYDINNLNIRY